MGNLLAYFDGLVLLNLVQLKRWLLHKYLKIRTTLSFVYLCNKATLKESGNSVLVGHSSIISDNTI